jgi:hypothetical protein
VFRFKFKFAFVIVCIGFHVPWKALCFHKFCAHNSLNKVPIKLMSSIVLLILVLFCKSCLHQEMKWLCLQRKCSLFLNSCNMQIKRLFMKVVFLMEHPLNFKHLLLILTFSDSI